LRDEPVLVSDFNGELVILRELFQEWSEPSEEVIHAGKLFLLKYPNWKSSGPSLSPNIP